MPQLNLSEKLRRLSSSSASPRERLQSEHRVSQASYFDVFRTEILRQLADCRSELDALRQIAGLIARQKQLLGLWFFTVHEDGTGQSVSLIDREATSLWQLDPALQECCVQALQTLRNTRVSCSRWADHVAVAAPVPSESTAQVFCGLVPSQPEKTSGAVGEACVLLELASQYLLLWRSWNANRQSETFSRFAALVMNVISSMSGKADLPGAGLVLVNHFRDMLACQRVALLFRDTPQSELKMLAVSGTDAFDAHSPLTVLMQTVGRAAVNGGEPAIWRRTATDSDSGEQVDQLAHRQLADQLQADCTMVIPITDCRDQPNGALLVAGEIHLAETGATLCSSKLFGNMIGSQLDLLSQARTPTVTRGSKAVVRFVRSNLGRVILAATAVISLVMLVPLPHKIKSDCVIEPVSRRLIAAPFDGKLERTMVQPGDLVQAGDVLARLDGSVIRMELSSLRAEYERESKRCDAALSSGNIAESQIAQHEMQKIALDVSLLEKRMANLEIKSPLAGVVVSGDLQKVEGAPLAVGQSLFEIAPLGKMVVEVFVPEEEISYVEPGMQVAFRTDAYPLSIFTGTITRVHPRSEMRNEQSVFVAELLLENAATNLRPGMNGTAKIVSQRRALGWIMFHKAWEKMVFQCGL